MMKMKLMRWRQYAIALVVLGLSIHPGARGDIAIPNKSDVSFPYLSTALLLAPCDDYSDQDAIYQISIVEARREFPKGTCADETLKELIFKARFLQGALITSSDDPISMSLTVEDQNAKLAMCNDTACLRQRLIEILETKKPAYMNTPTEKVAGFFQMESIKKIPVAVTKKIQKDTEDICPATGFFAHVAQARNGTFLIARCEHDTDWMPANSPSWMYKITNGRAKLVLSDVSDLYPRRGSCNGLPDLESRARVNGGEYIFAIYRFDGKRYSQYMGYTGESVGEHYIARYAGVSDGPLLCQAKVKSNQSSREGKKKQKGQSR